MSNSIAVKTLLSATTRELGELQHIAERLQSVISASETQNADTLKAFQRLDYLTQSLEALSEFWVKTETQISSDFVVNCQTALEEMRLKDLASALRGEKQGETKSAQGVLEEF